MLEHRDRLSNAVFTNLKGFSLFQAADVAILCIHNQKRGVREVRFTFRVNGSCHRPWQQLYRQKYQEISSCARAVFVPF